MSATPIPSLVIRESPKGVFYEAKFRWQGQQVKRRIGPAWVERGSDGWQKKAGRAPAGYFDPRSAPLAAAEITEAYIKDFTEVERVERERRTAGVRQAGFDGDGVSRFRAVGGGWFSELRRDQQPASRQSPLWARS